MPATPHRPVPGSVREVDVEVIPPGQKSPQQARAANDPLLALIARLMDSLFTVPGTKVKVGIDPILSLIPLVGSPASAVVSLLTLFRAAQAGVPNAVLARMGLNVLFNTLLGEIPIAGDIVSVFFRSNAMNYELLQKHAGTKKAYTATDRLVILGIVMGVMLLVVCTIVGFLWLTAHLIHSIFGGA